MENGPRGGPVDDMMAWGYLGIPTMRRMNTQYVELEYAE